jgi:hypothetical protein
MLCVIVCWTLTLAFAIVLLWPGLMDQVLTKPLSATHALDALIAPAWFRLLVVGAGVVLAPALVILTELRVRAIARHRIRHTVARELIVVAAVGFPAIALLADRQLIAAAIAAVVLVGTVVARFTRPRLGLAALGAAVGWGVLFVDQLAPDSGRVGSWVWITLFGLAAAGAAFVGYYGVQRAAESRSDRLRFLFRT